MAQIRAVTPADYDAIAEFLKDFGDVRISPAVWLKRMRHWWDANPAMREGFERGFMIDDGGRVGGFLGAIPRLVDSPDGIRLSCNTTTWWVLPEHRKLSLGLLARTLSLPALVHINTTPADVVIAVMKAMKFEAFPGAERHHESLLITSPGRVAAETLIRRVPLLESVGPALRVALDPVGRLALSARGKRVTGTLRTAVLDRAGAEFDALWEARNVRMLTADRSAASINWFVFGNPDLKKTLVACYRGASLAGFAILVSRDSERLRLLDCVDLYRREDDPDIIASLVAACGAYAREQRVAGVGFRHFDAFLAATFGDLGLLPRARPDPRELIRTASGTPLDGSRCFLTQLHGDRWL